MGEAINLHSPDPTEAAVVAEMNDCIREQMNKLPEKYRMVMMRRDTLFWFRAGAAWRQIPVNRIPVVVSLRENDIIAATWVIGRFAFLINICGI